MKVRNRCDIMKKYLPRYTDQELKESLEYMGAVLITGPKWCGKTTTAKQQSKSIRELQHPIYGKSYLKLADTNPIELLNDEKPLLIFFYKKNIFCQVLR